MTRVCVPLAPGFEELEAVTVIDVLRRAEIDVVTAGLDGRQVTGSHGITLHADALLSDIADQDWDLVVLPGGMPGSANLRDDPTVQALLRRQHAQGRRLAAICAAPIALQSAGVLVGKRATSYPGFADDLSDADYCDDRVVVDGTVVTSRGPGTSLAFALRLVAELVDEPTADALREAMLVTDPAATRD